MCVGTLSSSMCWGPLSGGRYPYVHEGEVTARIKDPANPSMQTGAGAHIPSGTRTPGMMLKTQFKGEPSAAKLGATFECGLILSGNWVTLLRCRSMGGSGSLVPALPVVN